MLTEVLARELGAAATGGAGASGGLHARLHAAALRYERVRMRRTAQLLDYSRQVGSRALGAEGC